jgi:hypothetical protein
VAGAEDVILAGPGFAPVTVAGGVDAASVQLAGQDASMTSTDVSGRAVLHFDKQALGLTAATTSRAAHGYARRRRRVSRERAGHADRRARGQDDRHGGDRGTAIRPVSNDPVTLGFTQAIAADDALRTGSYAATVTLALSTTTP